MQKRSPHDATTYILITKSKLSEQCIPIRFPICPYDDQLDELYGLDGDVDMSEYFGKSGSTTVPLFQNREERAVCSAPHGPIIEMDSSQTLSSTLSDPAPRSAVSSTRQQFQRCLEDLSARNTASLSELRNEWRAEVSELKGEMRSSWSNLEGKVTEIVGAMNLLLRHLIPDKENQSGNQ